MKHNKYVHICNGFGDSGAELFDGAVFSLLLREAGSCLLRWCHKGTLLEQ